MIERNMFPTSPNDNTKEHDWERPPESSPQRNFFFFLLKVSIQSHKVSRLKQQFTCNGGPTSGDVESSVFPISVKSSTKLVNMPSFA